MSNTIDQEVKNALTTNQEDIPLEALQSENSSPLNQPVIEKDIGGERPIESNKEKQKNWNVWKPGKETDSNPLSQQQTTKTQTDYRSTIEAHVEHEKAQEPLDAPEQEINGTINDDNYNGTTSNQEFEIPLTQANRVANALLGMSNNILVVGGGYFVKINKHKEFFEFEEIIQVIDQQNAKNVKRIKLDKEDQDLLRPLLAQVLKNKAKQLTPEQQLMGAIISILVKKAQIVMEVRAENNLLEARILDIIREEKGYSDQDEIETKVEEDTEENKPIKTQPPLQTSANKMKDNESNITPSIIEVAEV